MGGMTRRVCVVVVVVLCSQQMAGAQDLVNLVEPRVSDMAPMQFHSPQRFWMLFDGDRTTSMLLERGKSNPWGSTSARYRLTVPYTIRPTHYRVILPADVDPADAPTSWSLYSQEIGTEELFETKETRAVFKNGVYEGVLSKTVDARSFIFSLWDFESKWIAEIELLGPREALDALWPLGDYPCDQRLSMIPVPNTPQSFFSRSKNDVDPNERRSVFRPSAWGKSGTRGTFFEFDNHKPVLVGIELPKGATAHEVVVNGQFLKREGVQKVVLQGNFCQNNCDRLGTKGWVRVAKAKPLHLLNPDFFMDGVRIYVKNPDAYKAYRLKIIPRLKKRNPKAIIRDVLFMGCQTSTA